MKAQADIDFIYFLKRSYYIKAHLSERLDELAVFPLFAQFQETFERTIASLNLQLNAFDRYFESSGIIRLIEEGEYIFPFLESVFTMIQIPEDSNATLYLLDYLSVADALLAETVNMAETCKAHLVTSSLGTYPVFFGSTLQPLKWMLEESIATDCIEN